MNPELAAVSLPASTGIYILHLHLSQARDLHIGSLGVYTFPAGEYLYTGSAFGPGGLRARLGRHLRGSGKPHWHIDALRAAAEITSFCFCKAPHAGRETGQASTRLECCWSQRLASLPGACAPVQGFGSSDCRAGCRAHLVAFPPHSGSFLADICQSGVLVMDGLQEEIHFGWQTPGLDNRNPTT